MSDLQSYVAIFEEPIPEDLVTTVQESLSPENVYSLSQKVILLRGTSTTPVIRNLLEISEDGYTGVVFRLNGSYSGYHYEKLWDWLQEGR